MHESFTQGYFRGCYTMSDFTVGVMGESERADEEPCDAGGFKDFAQTQILVASSGLSVALAFYSIANYEYLSGWVRSNHSSNFEFAGVVAMLGAGIPFALAFLLWAGFPRTRRYLALAARGLSPLLLTAFFPALFCWRLWQGHDLEHLFFSGALVLATKALFDFALTSEVTALRERPLGRKILETWSSARELGAAMVRALPRTLGFWTVAIGVSVYVVFFSYHTIVHHRNVLTASFDLGLEENIIYNIVHNNRPILKSSPLGGPMASHLGSHATWFAYLLAVFYAPLQRTETLLVIQAILMGAAAIPLFLLAKRFVSTATSVAIAYLYLLYPGLHGAALYDFHYLPLGPFFLWYALYFAEKKRWAWVVVFALISLSVREDVAVSLGFLGGLWLLAGRRPRASLGLLLLGAGYFVVMKGIVMHRAYGGGDAFVHQYKLLIPEGDRGFSGVVKTILSNPTYTLSTLVERQKLVYLLQILLPLSFFPLRRLIGIWACVPGLLFALFSTEYPPLLMISFQYTTYWSAQLFPLMILNFHWMDQEVRTGARRSSWKWSWYAAILLGALAMTYQYGALLQQHTVIGGFGRYHFGVDSDDIKRRKDVGKLLDQIPRTAKVVASENVVPQIANRVDVYTLRISVFDADYIVFRCPNSGDEAEHVVRSLESGAFGVVMESGEYVLAKRGYLTEKNEMYIGRLGGRRHDSE